MSEIPLKHWVIVGLNIIEANQGVPLETDVNPLISLVENALGANCWELLIKLLYSNNDNANPDIITKDYFEPDTHVRESETVGV